MEINNYKIPNNNSTKYLGIILDDNLNFKAHCSYVRNKLIKLTAVFYYMSSFLDRNHCRTIYFAYIHPHLMYGIELFGLSSKGNNQLLQRTQNKLLKMICKCDLYYSPTTLHKELGIFSVKEAAIFVHSSLVYKQRNGLLPTVFDNMFLSREQSELRSHRNPDELVLPNLRLGLARKANVYISAAIWNQLPRDIKNVNTIESFKRR